MNGLYVGHRRMRTTAACGRPTRWQSLLDDLGHEVPAPVQEGSVIKLLQPTGKACRCACRLSFPGSLPAVMTGRYSAEEALLIFAFSDQSRNAMLAIAFTWRVPATPRD